MEKWTDIDTLNRHGWSGEPWVAYFAGSGYDVVMGFGQTYDEAMESARTEGREQGAAADTEYEVVGVCHDTH